MTISKRFLTACLLGILSASGASSMASTQSCGQTRTAPPVEDQYCRIVEIAAQCGGDSVEDASRPGNRAGSESLSVRLAAMDEARQEFLSVRKDLEAALREHRKNEQNGIAPQLDLESRLTCRKQAFRILRSNFETELNRLGEVLSRLGGEKVARLHADSKEVRDSLALLRSKRDQMRQDTRSTIDSLRASVAEAERRVARLEKIVAPDHELLVMLRATARDDKEFADKLEAGLSEDPIGTELKYSEILVMDGDKLEILAEVQRWQWQLEKDRRYAQFQVELQQIEAAFHAELADIADERVKVYDETGTDARLAAETAARRAAARHRVRLENLAGKYGVKAP